MKNNEKRSDEANELTTRLEMCYYISTGPVINQTQLSKSRTFLIMKANGLLFSITNTPTRRLRRMEQAQSCEVSDTTRTFVYERRPTMYR